MNKNISEEELLLRKRARRRLVGATVLVVIAVIVLPMVFDEPKPESEYQELTINFKSDDVHQETQSELVPSKNLSEVKVHEEIDPADSLPSEFSETIVNDPFPHQPLLEEGIKQTHVPIPGIKPKFSLVEQIVEVKPTLLLDGRFVVQLGAFSDVSKAQQQRNKLVSNGVNAYTETIKVNTKDVTRVRIGPFTTRHSAEDELAKLKKMGLDGVVTAQ